MDATKKHKGDIYQKELVRLEKANISSKQRETILRFHAHLSANRIGDERIVKLSWQLRKIAILLNKPFEDATKQDIEYVVGKINSSTCTISWKKGQPLSPSTKIDYGRVLKQFYKWLRNTKESPPEVNWIKTKLSVKEKTIKFDLITWDDINSCSNNANSSKDLGFINFIYESGGRIGEILNMKNRDVKFSDKFARVRLDGKTGERWIPIVTSTQLLAQYMQTKKNTNEEDYFWVSDSDKNKGTQLQYAGATKILRKLFARANIKKRCNPHSFRHSRATELSKTLTEPQLRLFFGWERGSDTPSVYTHLSGRDIDDVILNMNGLVSKKEQDEDKSRICSLCETVNRPKSNFCSKCGYGLTTKSVVELEDRKNKNIDDAMNYFMDIAKDPELLKKFEEFKQLNTKINNKREIK